jgi:hypothetical protein
VRSGDREAPVGEELSAASLMMKTLDQISARKELVRNTRQV